MEEDVNSPNLVPKREKERKPIVEKERGEKEREREKNACVFSGASVKNHFLTLIVLG